MMKLCHHHLTLPLAPFAAECAVDNIPILDGDHLLDACSGVSLDPSLPLGVLRYVHGSAYAVFEVPLFDVLSLIVLPIAPMS